MIKNKKQQNNTSKNKVFKAGNLLQSVSQFKGVLGTLKNQELGSVQELHGFYGKMAEGVLQFKKAQNGDWNLLENQKMKLLTHPFIEMGLKAFMQVKTKGEAWDFDLLWQYNNESFLGKKGFNMLLEKYGTILGLGGLKGWQGQYLNYGFSGGNVWMELKDFPLDFYGQSGAKATLLWRNQEFSLKIKGAFKKDGFPKINYQAAYQKGGLKGVAKGVYKNENIKAQLKMTLNDGLWSLDGKAQVKHELFKGLLQFHFASEGKEEGLSSNASFDFLREMQLRAKGKVQFQLNPYIQGDCFLVLDEEGFIEVAGALQFPNSIEIMPEKEEQRELFSQKIKAGYGVPLLAQIYLFAGISAYMKYGWEAVRLENLIAQGSWSNHPQKPKYFEIGAELKLGAYAGLGMQIEGGAGLTVLGHDLEASLALHAEALIKAQASLGTQIQIGEEEQRITSFFKAGAQLSLLLYGDFGLKIDAPFWSPIPDKDWSKPFGNKEFPMGIDLFEMGGKIDVDLQKGLNASEISMDEVEVDGSALVSALIAEEPTGAKKRPPAALELQSQAFKGNKKKGKSKEVKTKKASKIAAASQDLKGFKTQNKGKKLSKKALQQEVKKIQDKHQMKGVKQEERKEEGTAVVFSDGVHESTTVVFKTLTDTQNIRETKDVERGAFTFSMEGSSDEKSIYFSRKAHWPGGTSGITIGRGYDLAHRGSKTQILKELAGVHLNEDVFQKAIGLKGNAARDFLKTHQNEFPILSTAQENALFEISYSAIERDTQRLMNKEDVQAKYGAVDWEGLHPAIKEIVVDLRFRGDYSPRTRSFLQSAIVANDLSTFYTLMKDQSKWRNVPKHRFESRHRFLADYMAGGAREVYQEEKNTVKSTKSNEQKEKKVEMNLLYQVKATQLNVRNQPQIKGKKVDVLLQGTHVKVQETHGEWMAIGLEKWVHGAYLEPLENHSKSYLGWVQTEVLNIRKGPGTSYAKKGQLKKGEEVKVLQSETPWLKVGEEAWVHEDFIAQTKPTQALKPKTENKPDQVSGSAGIIDISKVGKDHHREVKESYAVLMQKERLDPSEIHKVRMHIKTLSPSAQADAYEQLQEKVHYKNQRNNKAKATQADLKRNSWMAKYGITSAGDLMCNLTAMAMALEYLGIENPDPRHQFEDFLEYYRQQKYGTQDRRNPNTWIRIASDFHVEAKSMPLNTSKKEQLEKLQSYLSGGAALLISMFSQASGKGHIVRLQKVEKAGLRVDDPYGKIADLGAREKGGSGYKHQGVDGRNSKSKEEGLGEDQLWTWDNLAQTIVKYAVYFKG